MRNDTFGPEEFQKCSGVSRETLGRLEHFVRLLIEWNQRHNLVSRRSLGDVWHRHVWDSAQLFLFIPAGAQSLVDLGSGAGFPGLILAAMCAARSPIHTVLFEATKKKRDFLELAAEQMGIEVEARATRIEDAPPEIFDVVTARACAPLSRLLFYAERFQGPRTRNLFLKGQNIGLELTNTHKSWRMNLELHASRSDPTGVVLMAEGLQRVG